MPTLPTLTVTDEQANRMLAAYGSVDNYLRWLTDEIIDFVLNKEARVRADAFAAQDAIKRQQDEQMLRGS